MKPIWMSALALAGAGWLTGCNPHSTVSTEEPEAFAAPEFSAKRGLLLPEQTRQSLGVKIVEVEERKLASTLELQLSVYRVTGGMAKAGGAVTSEEAKLLKVGQTVQVRLAQGKTQPGKVVGISEELQRATGSAEVLVELSDAPDGLAAGQFVRADVPLESKGAVVAIPSAALLQCSDGHSVFTVSGEHLTRTPVKVGARNAEFVEITDGLYAGDQVVVQPVMSLWMTELAAVKGGQACCAVPAKGK